mmetsp:Transcript_263/g.338  ORF Transcript_263/g.338 Transcript_263/m.338 type:complete len:466 (-) Transcript_263:265-1662(-)
MPSAALSFLTSIKLGEPTGREEDSSAVAPTPLPSEPVLSTNREDEKGAGWAASEKTGRVVREGGRHSESRRSLDERRSAERERFAVEGRPSSDRKNRASNFLLGISLKSSLPDRQEPSGYYARREGRYGDVEGGGESGEVGGKSARGSGSDANSSSHHFVSRRMTRRKAEMMLRGRGRGGFRTCIAYSNSVVGVSSFLRLGRGEAPADDDKKQSGVAMTRLLELVPREPQSYLHLLACPDPLRKESSSSDEREEGQVVMSGMTEQTSYDPLLVDDPDIQGKGKTVTPLQGYLATFIPYTAPSLLKNEINDQFRRRNPWAPEGLTLSKIRRLKADLLSVRESVDIDYSTIALAYVYLEKLTLLSFVQKENRRTVGAVCLYLAFKLNDPGCPRLQKELAAKLEDVLSVTKVEIHEAEFPVIVALSFCLRVPTSEVWPHIVRILNDEGLSPEEAYTAEALQEAHVSPP